jgi:post-segregation antitoxin (ccd killing protein)
LAQDALNVLIKKEAELDIKISEALNNTIENELRKNKKKKLVKKIK